MTKSKVSLSAAMIPISSVLVPEDVPNRGTGWEKKLDELMKSIAARGQIQPIVVVQLSANGPNGEEYKLLAGQRRLEAMKCLKHTNIKAVGANTKLSQKEQFGVKMAENFGRDNYTPLEEAALIEYAINTLGISQQDLAKAVGKTPGWVSQRLSAAKQPEAIQQALEEGDITFTHTRELARVKDDDEKKKLLSRAKRENAQDFKETVDSFLRTGRPPKRAKKSGKTTTASKSEDVMRPKKEAFSMIKRLDKAFVRAKKAEDKEKAKQISWFVKGVSWSYNVEHAKPPKL